MRRFKSLLTIVIAASSVSLNAATPKASDFVPYKTSELRPPSVPLLINDPFFSIWSNYDSLNDGPTRHWSEHEKALNGILRVDGTAYRFMGPQRASVLVPIAGMTVDGTEWSGRVSYTPTTGTAWAQPGFDDSSWSTEQAAWGTKGEYPNVKNSWTGENKDIYVRRTVSVTADDLKKNLAIQYSHDDVFELYINGKRVVSTGLTWRQGEVANLSDTQKSWLHEGENVIAAHCHNTTGGSYVDFGLYENRLQSTDAMELARQNSCDVMATSTYYNFTCGPVNLDLVFTAPMLIDDPDLISTPINFISYQVKSADGRKHDVQFYLSASPQFTVNEMTQPTQSSIVTENGVRYLKSGSEEQNYCGRTGDLITIDWGYLYIPAINGEIAIANPLDAERSFVETGKLPESAKGTVRSTSHVTMPSLAFANDLGNITEARDYMLIGYDEVYDMEYMHKKYKAYYARDGKTIFQAFDEFNRDYSSLMKRCRELDKKIYDDALAAGNVKYAEMLAANYRLVMGAHKLFRDDKGHMLYFSKENKSGGFVNTVDLTYPECPIYLLYNPELQKGMMLSILDYALTPERRGKNCAAHDLGIYPQANGMHYGDSMPLEESANMIILANAICRLTGDGEWLKPYAKVLRTWAEFCRDNGQNPGNQLCTDDFKGPSEQNTNLSLKAITAVAAYAELAKYIGDDKADSFAGTAKNMALLWEADARDGDHYRMEFHRPGTWSQKYNLVWDRMWGYNNFPAEIVDREVNFYLNHQQKYGLPLDSRDMQTKSDWIFWTASLAPDTDTFLRFSDRHWDYMNETTSRIPLSDFYLADRGTSCNFSGRSVIGGLWIKVLKDRIQPKPSQTAWEPKGNHIKTRWTYDVDSECPLPEYPRPLMVRKDWVNLNGLWDYAITDGAAPSEYEGKILVPYPIESSLSGVMRPLEPGKTLWYKREITIPSSWKGKRVLINFGAVDYDAEVYVNGTTGRQRVASHTGGHTAFSADITSKLTDGKATIYVKVVDSTDERNQPVGKQRRYPNGGGDIFYTSTSGIWQTVWLEPVESTYAESVRITPDVDNSTITFAPEVNDGTGATVTVRLLDGDNVVASKSAPAGEDIVLDVAGAKLWSPDSPFLYNVEVEIQKNGKTVDAFDSYAAMRKIGYAKNENGYWRLQLNNKDLFQFGPLDQGYWPDGLLTAPTDEALRYDVEKTKEWGFNMIRKHMKTEPARWYRHCDELGILVWQDMPSTFRSDEGWTTHTWYPEHNCSQDATVEKRYRNEWKEIIDQLYSYPCIVVWTPFNECWGQFKTADIVAYTQSLDNTRLVNPASGGNHYRLGEGTIVDQHTYDQPIRVFEGIFDPSRPLVLGEYGGLGRNIVGHRWFERDAQTYNTYASERAITDAFDRLAGQVRDLAEGYETEAGKISYGAAVYTQTTDVETEVNGLMTYDREIVKFNENRLRSIVGKVTGVYGTSGVEDVVAETTVAGDTIYYNINGLSSSRPFSGFNIVKESDGSTHKMMYSRVNSEEE